jgi:hypothetical protein
LLALGRRPTSDAYHPGIIAWMLRKLSVDEQQVSRCPRTLTRRETLGPDRLSKDDNPVCGSDDFQAASCLIEPGLMVWRSLEACPGNWGWAAWAGVR